jgi:hypothetical protein
MAIQSMLQLLNPVARAASSHWQHVKTLVWLFSSKTLFVKTGGR